MKISFSNTADDYLGYHMYMASKSGVIVKRRRFARYLFSIIYFLLGIYFFLYDSIILGAVFATLGILWFLFFPLMTKNSSAKFYRKYISENYMEKINRPVEMTFEENHVFVSDGINASRIAITELDKLIETKNNFYLKLKTAASFIIPKTSIDTAAFKSEMRKHGVAVSEELNWEWN